MSLRNKGAYRWTNIAFKIISDGLFVKTVPTEYKAFVGSRLTGINGVSMDNLCDDFAQYFCSENIIGKYKDVADFCDNEYFLRKFIPGVSADSVTYNLCSPTGEWKNITLPFLNQDEYAKEQKVSVQSSLSLPQKNLQYSFLDKDKKTMYFRCTNIAARDNFEYLRANGQDFYGMLKWYYENGLREKIPSDTLKAITSLQSFSGEFGDMLTEMKKHKTDNLIIDLRGNDGGFTPIVMPTLYQLWGDRYFTTDMNIRFYIRVSPFLMKVNSTTLAEFNKDQGTNYEFGDYIIEKDDVPPAVNKTVRDEFIDDSMSEAKDKLRKQNGKPVFTPQHVFVITDAKTFSAAFHYAFYLWKMGATVVGVPCSQAPNTYMEVTSFKLPRTHLQCSVSKSLQSFLPADDKRAKIFWPDMTITYNDFKNYNFDKDAEVLYILDYIKNSSSTDLK